MSAPSGGSTPSKKSPMVWFTRIFVGLIAAGAILLLWHAYSTDTAPTSQAGVGGRTSIIGGPLVGASAQHATPIGTYVVELPKAGVVAIPAKGGDWSDPVHVPSGFQIYRDADRGNGSFLTQSRNRSVGDDWNAGSSPNASEERYQSTGETQNVSYHFVPISAK